MPRPNDVQVGVIARRLADGEPMVQAARGIMTAQNVAKTLKANRYNLRDRVLEYMEKRGVTPEKIVEVYKEALDANTPVLVGKGRDAELSMVPDHRTRLLAADKVSDIMDLKPPKDTETGDTYITFLQQIGYLNSPGSADSQDTEGEDGRPSAIRGGVSEDPPEGGGQGDYPPEVQSDAEEAPRDRGAAAEGTGEG